MNAQTLTNADYSSIVDNNVYVSFCSHNLVYDILDVVVTCNVQREFTDALVRERLHGRKLARRRVDYASSFRKLLAPDQHVVVKSRTTS